MVKVAEFTGHTSRVLHLAQSPDGTTVVSGAADETLRFWRVFAEATVAQKVTIFAKTYTYDGCLEMTLAWRHSDKDCWTCR